MTGMADVQSFGSGLGAALRKPFQAATLIAAIDRLLAPGDKIGECDPALDRTVLI
jgi:hypothetical protein